jgi:hypothetical protein
MTAPQTGTIVSGRNVAVSASATGTVGVTGVQLWVSGAALTLTKLGAEDTTSPYSVVWNTTTRANGIYALQAVARDNAGNRATSSPVTTTVSNTAPTLSFTTSATSIITGESAVLTWASPNAASCSASNGWTGAKTVSGSQTVAPIITTTYVLTCTNFVGSIIKSIIATVSSHYISEAESGVLTSPMIKVADTLASNGSYVWVPQGAGNNYTAPGGPGKVHFSFTPTPTGTYRLWARTIAPDGGSDSFFVRVDGVLIKNPWTVPVSTTWQWSQVADISLTAVSHTLEFRQREDGTKLDKIILTTQLDNVIPANP